MAAWRSGWRRRGLSVRIAGQVCAQINLCRAAFSPMSCKWCSRRRIRHNSEGKSYASSTTQLWATTAKRARFQSARIVASLVISTSIISLRSSKRSTKSMLIWFVERLAAWVEGFAILRTTSVRCRDLLRKFRRLNKIESRSWIPLLRIYKRSWQLKQKTSLQPWIVSRQWNTQKLSSLKNSSASWIINFTRNPRASSSKRAQIWFLKYVVLTKVRSIVLLQTKSRQIFQVTLYLNTRAASSVCATSHNFATLKSQSTLQPFWQMESPGD